MTYVSYVKLSFLNGCRVSSTKMLKVHEPLFRSLAYGTQLLTECFTTTASLLITQCVCSEARAVSVL